MEYHFKVIPHNEQRYETVGDYWIDENGVTQIRVSDMGNDDYHFLVFDHEIHEQYLCLKRGIKEPDIMAYDIQYEKNRPVGDTSEPGMSKMAPYRREHLFATGIESLMASELDVDWIEYDNTVNEL